MDHIEWDDGTEDETPTLVDHIARLYDTLWKSWATCRGPFAI